MAGLIDLSDAVSSFTDFVSPTYWYDKFQEGQARDEARQVRGTDIARDEKWLERNSISGRIAEGASHGIGKLAALGAQGTGSASAFGQDTPTISKIHDTNAQGTRLANQLLSAQIESQKLDNLKKQQELVPKTTNPGAPGAGFMPGKKLPSGSIIEKPMERTATYPGTSHMEPGAVPGLGFESGVTSDGQRILYPVPSKDIKERIEDSPYELRNFIRDGILPAIGYTHSRPPQEELKDPKNNEWTFTSPLGGWVETSKPWYRRGTNKPGWHDPLIGGKGFTQGPDGKEQRSNWRQRVTGRR